MSVSQSVPPRDARTPLYLPHLQPPADLCIRSFRSELIFLGHGADGTTCSNSYLHAEDLLASLHSLLFRHDPGPVLAPLSASPLAVSARAAETAMLAYMSRRRRVLGRQMGPRGRDALQLLPYLLHVNQPGLPGFVRSERLPVGIGGYSPTGAEVSLAHKLFPQADVRRVGVFNPAIDLVAAMGSGGTIGFTFESDLDVWVCTNRSIGSATNLNLYRGKCLAIAAWLTEYSGVKTHLFLSPTEDIFHNDFGDTGVEGCGSAMGALLKEEFYRTGLQLAGKNPFWWLVPPDQDPKQYHSLVEELQQDPGFATDGYVDLGSVAQVPRGELFGAAVWQIVKGQHAPFKSALKMGLLEKTIHTETPRPLCEIVKERVLAGEQPDPYLILFDEVFAHYRGMHDTETEDLLARCFYLKTAVGLDPARTGAGPQRDTDAAVLAEYLRNWGWGPRQVQHLNEFQQWHFECLRGLAQEVDRFLLRTYKRIRAALDECRENQRITPHDLTILGRKLQTIYRRSHYKIETVHTVRPNVAVSSLSLCQEASPAGVGPWRLFRGRVTPLNAAQRQNDELRASQDLTELLAWACHNGLLGANTRLSCQGVRQQIPASAAEGLAQELLAVIPATHPNPPPSAAFMESPRTTRLLLIPNLGLGGEALREISAVYASSWGEHFYRRWTGPGALRRCCEEVLFPCIQDGLLPKSIRVFAPQLKVGGLHDGSRRMQRELPVLASTLLAGDEPHTVKRRYVGGDQGAYYVCERSGEEPVRFHGVPDSTQLVRLLSGVGPYHRVETRIEGHGPVLRLLKTLFEAAVPGMVDVFWLAQGGLDYLYVVDEIGNFTQLTHRARVEPYALARLLGFLESILPELAAQPEGPLGAPILGEVVRLHTVAADGTYRVRTSTHELLRRAQAMALDPVGLTIERTGSDAQPGAGYRITWGERAFQSGGVDDPLEEARNMIQKARARGHDYEVFLTRTVLDQQFQQQYCGSFSTTGHYLFYKRLIEQRLSAPYAASS